MADKTKSTLELFTEQKICYILNKGNSCEVVWKPLLSLVAKVFLLSYI